ncbi:DUF1349 domain-containing protein [Noviherbaspirillum galbum]|uniref:VCBS repeat-containing protein n=1 Tax=Noviherbaspirillum galbum TaxID=2709383 RepID=A0A6B3SNZ4_9BURK|nr:hypothetical protein [Noviherbaspirillum galbum]NEX62457.1 hypothetical protein [Noviherbaspirillum galbum]
MINIKTLIATSLLATQIPTLAANLHGNTIPKELERLLQPSEALIEFQVADLDGDGRSDYLFVVEDRTSGVDLPLESHARLLKIAIRLPDGGLKVVKSSDKAILCAKCGETSGDDFAGISASTKEFAVHHHGGFLWRCGKTFKFRYSRLDNTWQLVSVNTGSLRLTDPAKPFSAELRPPDDFGKIDISNFDSTSFACKASE